MSASLRVVLVDDHDIVRSGLRRLLEQNDGMQVVAEADNGEQAYKLFGELLPDVLVMDISMPGMGGLESLRRIISRFPAAKIVIFSMHENVAFATKALTIGARAYVAKAGMGNDVLRAVREVAAGRSYINPDMAQKIAFQNLSGGDDPVRSYLPASSRFFACWLKATMSMRLPACSASARKPLPITKPSSNRNSVFPARSIWSDWQSAKG